MKNIFSFLFIMLFFVSDIFGVVKTDVNINLGKDIQDDATSKVLLCIKNIHKEKNATITFEKGVYNFYPTHAVERFCYISNHDDLLSRIAFLLKNKKNITIEGNGSRFIFHGRLIPFFVEDCKNVTIKNLSIDFAEPFYSQGMVVAKNEKEKYFDLKISQNFPYEIRNDEIYFLKPYYYHGLGQAILYNPKTMGIAYNTNKYTPLTLKHRIFNQYGKLNYKYEKEENDDYICDYGWEYTMKVKEIRPGLVRIFGNRKSQPEVGMVLACNRARGILISTPKKTVIRNNYFNTEMSALLLPVESSSWYESGCASNVTIKGNVFQDCSISGSNAPVISFVTDDKNNNVAFNNINIVDNIFNQYSNYILGISNVDGLSFSKNTITNSHTYPKLYPNNPAFKISSSRNIVFKDNKYKGDAKKIIDSSKNKILVKFN